MKPEFSDESLGGIKEYFISNENLFSESSSVDEKNQAADEMGEQFLEKIRRAERQSGCGFEDKICFLDVLAIISQKICTGFVIAPSQSVQSSYQDIIKQLVNERMSIGNHPVFKAGLPSFFDSSSTTPSIYQPKTQIQLESYLLNLNNSISKLSYIRRSLLTLNSQICRSEKREKTTSSLKSFHLPTPSVSDNYGTRNSTYHENTDRFIDLLSDCRNNLYSLRDRPLQQIFAVPVTNWVKRHNGQLEPISYGAFFIGLDEDIDKDEEEFWIDKFRKIVLESTGAASRNLVDQMQGRNFEKANFAHQTSASIDTIWEGICRLHEDTKSAMGGLLLAQIHLLRAIINSYRTRDSIVYRGDFPYNWKDVTNPLEVYRDIGIQLGLARAQDANEQEESNVRDAAHAGLLPINQPGQAGFDKYRRMFMPLPDINASIGEHLRHSSFAVLILLSIKQAFYHTLRSLCRGNESAIIRMCVSESDNEIIFECQIWNPKVLDSDKEKESKDIGELRELAKKLSKIPSHPVYYSVEGPYFDTTKDQWVTKNRIHALTYKETT